MKTLIATLSLAFTIMTTFADSQKVKVDNDHLHLDDGSGVEKKIYKIHEAEEITFDAEGYVLRLGNDLKPIDVNSILVVVGRNQYRCEWSDKKRSYKISALTLKPVGKAPKFPGFKEGRVIIGIGVLKDKGFQPVWVSLIDITKKSG